VIMAEKLNYLRYIAHFRCIHRGQFFTEMRTTGVRKLLPSSWGFLCPVHTPDGSTCGLVNHMTRHALISYKTFDTSVLAKELIRLGMPRVGVGEGRPGEGGPVKGAR
jgi:DNA-directed RNA polymerase I subunit RPA2